MKPFHSQQRGSSLFVALIMLALLMILGSSTINDSMLELRAAGNTKVIVDGFQRADAGISATMDLADTANNPFDSTSVGNPFANIPTEDNPLINVPNVSVAVALNKTASTCARAEAGFSSSQIACEYYEVTSQHSAAAGGDATLRQGVSRQVIAN